MMTRDEIRELAAFQADPSKGASALSFYFQPDPPQDRSHRREAIVAKDVVKEALKSDAAQGKNGSLHTDLDRVLELAKNLRGNARARAVFACSAQNYWKEFELPPQFGSTHIYIQPRFQLKPLAALLGAQPALSVAMVDRQRARIFDRRFDDRRFDDRRFDRRFDRQFNDRRSDAPRLDLPQDLRERAAIVHMLSRSASSYGYNGYEAGHAERRVAEEALQHFKAVAERLRIDLEKGLWERLIVGCHDSNWPEFEPHLHPYVKQCLIGRFSADVASVSNEEIRVHAGVILDRWIKQRASAKVDEALDQAKSNGRGVTGLRRVLRALETGEVQSLFLSKNYSARAVECKHCGHLDAHLVAFCVACGNATRELADVCDAVIPIAIRRDIELFYLKENDGLDRAGNIAAQLRFRSDQTSGEIAAAS
jgi:Bacterial archaeo-eukaryotic release factor family 10